MGGPGSPGRNGKPRSSRPEPAVTPWRRERAIGRRTSRADIDAAAVELLYRQHVSSVYAFFGCTVDRHTAEDLTAATFERVVRSWRRYDPARASRQTWIFAIARNVLIDHLRRQRHRVGPSLNAHPEIVDSIACAEDPLAAAVDAEAIRGWLTQLRPREQEVVALRYCADVSVADIARCLHLTEGNVHQICSRALRRLRSTIAEEADVMAGGTAG